MYDVLCYRVTDPEMPYYGEPPTSVWRRYSEFELLRSYLEVTYPAIVVPPLPEKRASVSFCCMLYIDCKDITCIILHIGHVDESATEFSLLLQSERGTGC